MMETVKKLFLYALLDKDQYNRVLPLVAAENAAALKLATIVQILYFGASYVSSLGLQEMADKRLVYAFGTVVPAIILAIQLVYAAKNPRMIPTLVDCFSGGAFFAGLLCTLVCTPDEMTILLLIFFFCIPLLYVIRPIEIVFLVFLTDFVYFILAPLVKSPEILEIDMIDVGIFSTLSLILGINRMHGGFRRYWLEVEAVELAEIRYRAAFIDQLTGVYNRNAYNRDMEKLTAEDISADFLFIAMDLNGLKKTNDTYGHAAGDELIVGAAECMTKSFSDYGSVYRIGGDEFIVMLRTKGENGGDLLHSFNQALMDWKGIFTQKLSVSYGVVPGGEAKNLSYHEMELLADKRMYQAKNDYYKNEISARCGQ